MAILNSDGSINPSFTGSAISGASGQVTVATLEPGGTVLVGGTFGPFNGSSGPYFAAFSSNGQSIGVNSYLNGPVNAIAVLPGGSLTGSISNYAVWLEANGTVRYTFSAAANGQVISAVQQPDGKILVGGAFSFGTSTATQYLVRVNTDGTIDSTFNPSLNGEVYAILLQSDGKIIIGGTFTDLLANNVVSYMARLNTDGTLDTSYQPSPNNSVTTLAMQSDGKVLVGGNFSAIETTQTTTTIERNFAARLNTDGTLDTTFNPDPNGVPSSFIELSNGNILMGGNFSTVDPNFGSTTYTYGSLVELNPDGTLDTSYNPSPNGAVDTMVLQPDGKLLVGGAFGAFTPNSGTTTTVQPSITTGSLARINTDGSIDTTFEPMPNGEVSAIDLLANGQVLIAGSFNSLQPNGAANPTNRFFLARLNSNGTVDPSFDTELNDGANSIITLQDGSLFIGGAFTNIDVGGAVFIGGSFTTIGGTPAPYLARLNADSTVDSTFSANADGTVYTLVVEIDSSVIVGGSFAHVGSIARSNVARLDSFGQVDTAFNPSANAAVAAVAVQPDGNILLGGAFTTVGGQTAQFLARVSPTGTLDASFTPLVNGPVDSVVVLPNGQIVIAGSFTGVSGQSVGRIARLNTDGSVDTTFNPNANGPVAAVALLSDGTLVAGGSFTTIGGQAIPYAAHLAADGTVDTTFVPAPNAPVSAVLVQPDGKVFIGGSFTSVGGQARCEIARLATPTGVEQTLAATPDESTIIWTHTGPAPTFASVRFEESTDGTHWTMVGQATQVSPSTWQLTGIAPVGSATFLIRATGLTPSTAYASSGIIQQIQAINTTAIPAITSPGPATGGSGAPFSFTVTATQLPTYYSASGLPPGLTINTSTGVISGTPSGSGTYNVKVSAGNASGVSSSSLAITIGGIGATSYTPAAGSASDRLTNLSCRAELPGSGTLIAGFVISGTTQKTVLLRAVGPGLSAFNVPGAMAAPELQLYSNSGSLITQNSSWGGSSSIAAVMAQVGAFPLAAGSADCAMVTSLAPGAYTIHVSDPTGKGGVVLTEIYDASASPLTDTSRLVNISARGAVSSGAGALIGGFVVSGSSTKSVIIRGVGPGLAAFSVPGWLADPVLSVYDTSGALVAQNLSWGSQALAGPYQASVGPGNIINLDAIVGAFALATADTAVVADLPPGAYTFQITSASGATGQALGEVYELP
jgi:uncharacterized delta-60 repeat protein